MEIKKKNPFPLWGQSSNGAVEEGYSKPNGVKPRLSMPDLFSAEGAAELPSSPFQPEWPHDSVNQKQKKIKEENTVFPLSIFYTCSFSVIVT